MIHHQTNDWWNKLETKFFCLDGPRLKSYSLQLNNYEYWQGRYLSSACCITALDVDIWDVNVLGIRKWCKMRLCPRRRTNWFPLQTEIFWADEKPSPMAQIQLKLICGNPSSTRGDCERIIRKIKYVSV